MRGGVIGVQITPSGSGPAASSDAGADSVRRLRSDGWRSREAILDAADALHCGVIAGPRCRRSRTRPEWAARRFIAISRLAATSSGRYPRAPNRSAARAVTSSETRSEDPLLDGRSATPLGSAAGADPAQFDGVRPAGQLGREGPLSLDAIEVLDSVPPHLVAEQLVAEAQRIAGVPVALYLVDVDGSRLVRLAGSREFPAHFNEVVALGGEIPPDGFAALESRMAEQFPGSAPYPMMVRGRAIGVLVAVRRPGASLRELARQGAAAIELTSAYTDVFEGGRRTRQPSPAAELQLGLLPPRIMRVTGAELAGDLVPAYESGGDWFDFADNHDGAWFAIADPKGRGPVSTALGALALSALRSARRSDATLEEAAMCMDQIVREVGGPEFTVNALVARWNAPTSRLDWIDCDGPPLMIASSDGHIQRWRAKRRARWDPRTARRAPTPRATPAPRATADSVLGRRLDHSGRSGRQHRITDRDRTGDHGHPTCIRGRDRTPHPRRHRHRITRRPRRRRRRNHAANHLNQRWGKAEGTRAQRRVGVRSCSARRVCCELVGAARADELEHAAIACSPLNPDRR